MAKKAKAEKKKIVFVCTGNTCRSPMADILFRYILGKKRKLSVYDVSSAGLCACDGDPMTENAVKAMAVLRVPIKRVHTAHALTRETADKADLIVCMTGEHKNALAAWGDKVKSVRELTGGNDVPDPYGGDLALYVKTAEYLLYACEDIFAYAQNLPAKK